MVRLSAAPAVGVVDAAESDRLLAAAGLTVRDRPAPLLTAPSLTTMLTVSALGRVMTPLLEPDTVATPLAKVMAVADPKLMAVPELLVTLGLFDPMVLAPPKVRFFDPV